MAAPLAWERRRMGWQQDFQRRFSDEAVLRQSLRVESREALRKGALCALGPAIAAVVVLSLRMSSNPQSLGLPWGFCLLSTGLGGALYLLAHTRQLEGWGAYAFMVPFASFPTFFFLLCHVLMPTAETASIIHGLLSSLYFLTVAATGLLLDFWLTASASVVAAAGFELCLSLARNRAGSQSGEEAFLWSRLVDPLTSDFKALMILSCGLIVAALAALARRLVMRTLDAARAADALKRLFGQYIREEVHPQLLYSPGTLEGERQEVAVLVMNLHGFTEYSESVRAGEVVARLNAYFEAMVQAITLRGGAIDHFIGDTMLATFGGWTDVEVPCTVALEAAREIRIRLELLNASPQVRGRTPFENGIGLHVGEVVLGAIGSELHRDFTVVGSAINTASRVEALTKQYGHPILLTGTFYERLPRSMKALCRSLGTAQVKGSSAPMELYGVPEGPSTPGMRAWTLGSAPP